ncbi:MAG: nucleotide exchange factor GrpE [Burkholderiaceae bacterium]|nr:nucleotide exchange factor GrpE [Pseudomonadota bacterium]MCO5115322.1 nucleotide exchange factor GrpE [Burkholderiaceae bacterium]MCP5218328.1 nucleotide exchange factor GrpE [Burkholderiaceae bacterium]
MTPSTPNPFDPPMSPEEIEAAAAADAADSLAQEQNTQAELTALQAKVTDLVDQAMRAQAEAQNARRRADEEVAKVRKFAVESFAESLLAVVDSLEAALKVENASAEQLLEGTRATHRQLMNVLERNKVTEVNPAPGTKFDPTREQAIGMVPADQDPNTIVSVLQKGYVIADRVLRPAMVMVAAPK